MKVELNPCFILHQRHYRETSLILDVFSRKQGRLSVIAKGAKGPKSKFRGLLRIHQKTDMAWAGRGEMGTLTDVELQEKSVNLSGSGIISAFYMNELLVRLLHQHEPHPELFDYYEEALNTLVDQEEQLALRLFEKNLVESLGYGLILDHEVDTGNKISEQKSYYYKLDQGPSLTKQGGEDVFQISGKALSAMSRNDLYDQSVLNEARRLLKPVLKHHLGSKPLKSRELYKAYLESTRE